MKRNRHSKISNTINQQVIVECKDIDSDGCGISVYKEMIVVTDDLLPGEIAKVELLKLKKKRWISKLVCRIKDSTIRVKSQCSYFEKCGGCTLQHINDKYQSKIKVNRLLHLLKTNSLKFQNIEEIVVDIQYMKGYRNKAVIPLRRNSDRILLMGYYKFKSHEIVDISACNVLDKRLETLIKPCKKILAESDINADCNGILPESIRHLSLRIASHTGQILITLITNSSTMFSHNQSTIEALYSLPNVVGVNVNIQSEPNNLLFGDLTSNLIGKNHIEDYFCGYKFHITSSNFYQVNSIQAQKVVANIVNWLKEFNSVETVIDAYCGIGTITLPLSSIGVNIIGLEISESSVTQAKNNAILNNLNNIRFICGDVNEHLSLYLNRNCALIVDPPRKGLEYNVLKTILLSNPLTIAYLSCNPETLVRDMKLLLAEGQYTINSIHPIDFFPQTTHIECLVMFKRVNS